MSKSINQQSIEATNRVTNKRPLAIVTGASAGIGYELAICCARDGFDLIVAADDSKIQDAADKFRGFGVEVEALELDLATLEGVDQLYDSIKGRQVDALLANAGHGLGGEFLDQNFDLARHVVDTNITGTIYLIQKIGRDMRDRGEGRILITGSIAGFIPGTYSAVYNSTKSFIDSFSFALRAELKDTGITVTCLMPGATETEFFERAGMTDTKAGQSEKDDPADVAKIGFDAMMRGDGDVVSGWKNKVLSAVATVTPSGVLAEQHRRMFEPGSGTEDKQRVKRKMKKTPLIAGGVIAGVGLAYAARALVKSERSNDVAKDVHVETSIAINRSPAELYAFWRDFRNLPLFMKNLESVTELDDRKSHWVAKGIGGQRVEWDAEIYNEKENELIAWRSLENSDVVNAGSVRFEQAPEGHGTYVRITLNYNPPAGILGKAIAQLLGSEPSQLISEDLRRLKQLIETGEIATTAGQPSGRAAEASPLVLRKAAGMASAQASAKTSTH